MFFANERTFLSWLNFTVILGALAIGMLNFGDRPAFISAFLFTGVAMMDHDIRPVTYHWRAKSIRKRGQAGFDDRLWPHVPGHHSAAGRGGQFRAENCLLVQVESINPFFCTTKNEGKRGQTTQAIPNNPCGGRIGREGGGSWGVGGEGGAKLKEHSGATIELLYCTCMQSA